MGELGEDRRVEADEREVQIRTAYDLVAVDYAELLKDFLAATPWDRAVLAAFAEQVLADGAGRVVEVGCGPGRITGHLRDLGLDVFGIDLSPAMVEVARRTHPDLRFETGTMTALDLADGGLDGVVAWYSVIHTPPEHQPAIYAELARVLRPGGHLVLAFQVGDECVHLEHAYGHDLSLDAHRLAPERVAEQVAAAGFEVTVRLAREPMGVEPQPQAYLVARRRPAPS